MRRVLKRRSLGEFFRSMEVPEYYSDFEEVLEGEKDPWRKGDLLRVKRAAELFGVVKEGGRWVWEADIAVRIPESMIPEYYEHEKLVCLHGILADLKEMDLLSGLEVHKTRDTILSYLNWSLEVPSLLSLRALDKKEPRGPEEAFKAVDWLFRRWKGIKEEAERRNLIWTDGESWFFAWEAANLYTFLDQSLRPQEEFVLKVLLDFTEVLPEVPGLAVGERLISWDGEACAVCVYRGAVEEALGEEKKMLGTGELREVLRFLSEGRSL